MEDMVQAGAAFVITGSMLTHVGLVRSGNEDVVAFAFPRRTDPGSAIDLVALVADGMGGHAAGEVASRMAADIIMARVTSARSFTPDVLYDAIMAANAAVFVQSRSDPGLSGMGTTVTAAVVAGRELYLGHVGDSRAYIVSAGKARQISEDHSLVADMLRQGVITEDEAAVSPHRNVITRALGRREELQPDVYASGLPLCAGEMLLLCSDGVSDLLTLEDLARLTTRRTPGEACDAIVEAALAAGGHDNISIGVFAFDATTAFVPVRPRITASFSAIPGPEGGS